MLEPAVLRLHMGAFREGLYLPPCSNRILNGKQIAESGVFVLGDKVLGWNSSRNGCVQERKHTCTKEKSVHIKGHFFLFEYFG
jgi:hypothetical protein